MSTEANKKYHPTNVPFSAYRVGAKHMLHINRAVKAIRRNDFESLKELMEKDPSVHKSGARKPVLFFAIKYRKSAGLHAIVNDPGFDQAYRAYASADVLHWLMEYFNVDVFNAWKDSKYYKDRHIHLILIWATMHNCPIRRNIPVLNNPVIRRVLSLGANPDYKDTLYSMSAREYATKFECPCLSLFRMYCFAKR